MLKDAWNKASEEPKWEDFPVVVVYADDNRSAHLMLIEEANVEDAPTTYYQRRSWELLCQWHNIAAWKTLDFREVNKEADVYLNLSRDTTWT